MKSDKKLEDLSNMFNPIIRGWIQYYGQFYKSENYMATAVHERGIGALGKTKVQEVEISYKINSLARKISQKTAKTGNWGFYLQLGDGIRMSREVHVRF